MLMNVSVLVSLATMETDRPPDICFRRENSRGILLTAAMRHCDGDAGKVDDNMHSRSGEAHGIRSLILFRRDKLRRLAESLDLTLRAQSSIPGVRDTATWDKSAPQNARRM